MLAALTFLILCQLIGEIVTHLAGWPFPGPVLGILLLLVWLIFRGKVDVELREAAGGLLRHLSLLFVPAGVGVVTELGTLGREWFPIVVSLVVSTVLGLVVTAWLMELLSGPAEDAR